MLLNCHGPQPLALLHLVMFKDRSDLVGFTAKANQKNTAEIRMASISLNGAYQQAVALGFGIERAAAAVGQSNDTIHIVETVQPALLVEIISDVTGHRGGTVHGSYDANVIARTDTTQTAIVTHKGAATGFGQHALFFDIDAELVSVLGRNHREVMKMYVPPGLDVLGRDTDDLSVFQDLFA